MLLLHQCLGCRQLSVQFTEDFIVSALTSVVQNCRPRFGLRVSGWIGWRPIFNLLNSTQSTLAHQEHVVLLWHGATRPLRILACRVWRIMLAWGRKFTRVGKPFLGLLKLFLVEKTFGLHADGELTAFTWLAFDLEFATQAYDDSLADTETQAHPLLVLILSVFYLSKVLKEALLVFFWDATTRVFEHNVKADQTLFKWLVVLLYLVLLQPLFSSLVFVLSIKTLIFHAAVSPLACLAFNDLFVRGALRIIWVTDVDGFLLLRVLTCISFKFFNRRVLFYFGYA